MAPKAGPSTVVGRAEDPSAEDISGVREQIISNAILLFPGVIKNTESNNAHLNPADLFNIVLRKDDYDAQFQAFIVQTGAAHHNAIMQGPKAETVFEAIFALLESTCYLIMDHREMLCGLLDTDTDTKTVICPNEGHVNKALFYEGVNWVKRLNLQGQS